MEVDKRLQSIFLVIDLTKASMYLRQQTVTAIELCPQGFLRAREEPTDTNCWWQKQSLSL